MVSIVLEFVAMLMATVDCLWRVGFFFRKFQFFFFTQGDDTSHEDLTNLGGEDFPFFGNSEAMLAFFDFNLDSEFEFDFVVGYPGQIPYGDVGKTKPKNIDGFGVYRYQFYPNQSPSM